MKAPRFTDLIGNTPLIDLTRLVSENSAELYAKCEFINPGFSLKDRMANYILDVAEAQGKLKRGDVIVCSSSGNTGCSFAMLGKIRGYHVVIVTSNKCSIEKQNHIKALNADLIIVTQDTYMSYGENYAKENGYFDVNQYNNIYNPEAYYQTLGPEIWKQTNGEITHFVMTGSTFGCISGTGSFLKECNPKVKVILADPVNSNIYAYYYSNYSNSKNDLSLNSSLGQFSIIEGAGKSAPTKCLNFSVIDEVVKVSDEEAISTCHQLAKDEGLLVGGSSGLNVFAAKLIANRLDRKQVVVTVLCDSGIKYLSKIYNQEFLSKNGLKIESSVSTINN
ncbi:MAG: cysteine synthase family protein [Okeania sp. SIO2G4]|uniref:PLP-dependent cysteine synthase family protein n=1 Tax=unclassified Okeania TaxID=2634635 RepID=UPI0013B8EC99|nr:MULTISPECIES: cysteine synthase family protein [unclassified Okeania]NEP73650.1 cysteine synthase family protein [Okeania sp. SIO2G5]NEP94400.1 cysteine synthase family protein [Okeania sp. SIO2F5]NEQ92210.1 cysteine synthase family protein [Okeania sp. SIO2G4]